MNWQTTYPTIAVVMEAGFSTLSAWDEKLPPPQSDVERTVRRRIKVQLKATAGPEMRKTNEGAKLADEINAVFAQVERLTGIKGLGRVLEEKPRYSGCSEALRNRGVVPDSTRAR